MKTTITLYDYIESELQRQGKNEFFNGNEMTFENITFFNDDSSFMRKMMKYDKEVSYIVDNKFFIGQKLENPDNDLKFKKGFFLRFMNRQINRQTIEDFATQVAYTFIANEEYINRLYNDLDQYLSNKTISEQTQTGNTTTDNRSAYSELPQDNVQLDVNSTVMESAKDNTISRNKQQNDNQNNSENTSYKLDDLMKINGLIDQIYDVFDKKCFLQIW